MSGEELIPASFICPLTQEVMADPVVDPEGNSYERAAIEAWLKKEPSSPITRTPLLPSNLAPNRALKDAIDIRLKQLGIPLPVVEKPVAIATTKALSTKPEDTTGVIQKAEGTTKGETASTSEEGGPETVQIKVSAAYEPGSTGGYNVLVSLKPPVGTIRTPVDICCVIDISGSMGSEAKMKTADGGQESHGLSLLDIVKHAVKTISRSLHSLDRLGIVVYSTQARVAMALSYVNEAVQKTVDKTLDSLNPEDTTNIWDGLQTGLDMLRKGSKPGRIASLLLLTDGMPNVSPPRGEVAMFKRYIEKNHAHCIVSTFGFGYSLNSELLLDIAKEGGGMFSFIPDSTFVGTTFVNAASNMLVTMGTNVAVHLEAHDGASIVSVMGRPGANPVREATVRFSTIQYGQDLAVLVKMNIPATLPNGAPYLRATLKFDHWNFTQPVQLSVEATDREGSPEVNVQRCRIMVVEGIQNIVQAQKADLPASVAKILREMTTSLKTGTDPREKGLLEDVTGQVTEAVSKAEYYKRWGCHYLPSLMRAHQLQQSNNFKDVGIQFYGGALFQKIRDEIDDIFCSLPPPKPSARPVRVGGGSGSSGGSGGSYTQPSKPFSMATYNSNSNPCFDGSCSVLLADGSYKNVCDIVKGDRVATSLTNKQQAEVVCVLKTLCHANETALVEMEGGLLVTPYHPIKVNGEWRFPCDVKEATTRYCTAVYSFVLKDTTNHAMIINGIECVTLGHNFSGSVVSHPYFGTHKVVDDLRRMCGWEKGVVELRAGCLVRDPQTGLVCGLRHHDEFVCSIIPSTTTPLCVSA